jgi:hypothetical protein
MQLTAPIQIQTIIAVSELLNTSEVYLARMLFYDLGTSGSDVTHSSKANHNSLLNVLSSLFGNFRLAIR